MPSERPILFSPRVLVELILIVVGILSALAIDGWAQDRRDRESERTYLELLVDDLGHIEDQLQSFSNFETANIATAASLYEALAVGNPERDPRRLQRDLTSLSVRRTVQVTSASYTDLQSTGNLRIIRNHELRQRIIRYFAQTERLERVIEKNNTAFVDELYNSTLLETGVTIGFSPSNEPNIAEAEALLRESLGDGSELPPDAILLRPPDASSWDSLRRLVIFRARISAVGVISGSLGIEWTVRLREAIEEELRNPI